MNLKHGFAYIRFWIESRSRFDIHSPFVYQIWAKVIRDHSIPADLAICEKRFKGHRNRYDRLAFRFIRFFHPSQIVTFLPENHPMYSYMEAAAKDAIVFSSRDTFPKDVDLVVVDLTFLEEHELKTLEGLLQHIQKDSVFMVINLRNTLKEEHKWKRIKEWSEITISIDLFQLGLLFFNRNLSREEFKLTF